MPSRGVRRRGGERGEGEGGKKTLAVLKAQEIVMKRRESASVGDGVVSFESDSSRAGFLGHDSDTAQSYVNCLPSDTVIGKNLAHLNS